MDANIWDQPATETQDKNFHGEKKQWVGQAITGPTGPTLGVSGLREIATAPFHAVEVGDLRRKQTVLSNFSQNETSVSFPSSRR